MGHVGDTDKTADERLLSERSRRVRRKPGVDRLGDGDALRARGHVRGGNGGGDGASSHLEVLEHLDREESSFQRDDEHYVYVEKRRLWESSLRKGFGDLS